MVGLSRIDSQGNLVKSWKSATRGIGGEVGLYERFGRKVNEAENLLSEIDELMAPLLQKINWATKYSGSDYITLIFEEREVISKYHLTGILRHPYGFDTELARKVIASILKIHIDKIQSYHLAAALREVMRGKFIELPEVEFLVTRGRSPVSLMAHTAIVPPVILIQLSSYTTMALTYKTTMNLITSYRAYVYREDIDSDVSLSEIMHRNGYVNNSESTFAYPIKYAEEMKSQIIERQVMIDMEISGERERPSGSQIVPNGETASFRINRISEEAAADQNKKEDSWRKEILKEQMEMSNRLGLGFDTLDQTSLG